MTGARVPVGFVGAGAVALRHARDALRLGAEVVAVTDPVPQAARRFADLTGAAIAPDLDALVADRRLEALYICVPPFAHGPPEKAAIAAGLPFLVEKPLAAEVTTAADIAAALRERPTLTATGYHWRYLDTLARARALLADNPPRLLDAAWLDRRPPPPWWADRLSSGGQVVEQTTHVVDVLRALAGEVESVFAVGRNGRALPGPSDVSDATVATVVFRSGALATVSSTCVLDTQYRAGVTAMAAGLVVELTEADLVVHHGERTQAWKADCEPRAEVDRNFLSAVRGQAADIRAPYAEAMLTHSVACAIARSADRGEVVNLAMAS